MTTRDSDSERLVAIEDLQQAIEDKQPELQQAQHSLHAAREAEDEHRRAVEAVDTELTQLTGIVLMDGSAVYVSGPMLDRGSLRLNNTTLSFRGSTGGLDLPLQFITKVELHNSFLPPRAGVPVLGSFWPGRPRHRGSLLLTVEVPGGTGPEIAVLADLDDAPAWQDAILRGQHSISDFEARSAELQKRRRQAAQELDRAKRSTGSAQKALAHVQGEVDRLSEKKHELERLQRSVDKRRMEAAREAAESPSAATVEEKRRR
jgi:hypothetical protein